jgi:hypothetical protein
MGVLLQHKRSRRPRHPVQVGRVHPSAQPGGCGCNREPLGETVAADQPLCARAETGDTTNPSNTNPSNTTTTTTTTTTRSTTTRSSSRSSVNGHGRQAPLHPSVLPLLPPPLARPAAHRGGQAPRQGSLLPSARPPDGLCVRCNHPHHLSLVCPRQLGQPREGCSALVLRAPDAPQPLTEDPQLTVEVEVPAGDGVVRGRRRRRQRGDRACHRQRQRGRGGPR